MFSECPQGRVALKFRVVCTDLWYLSLCTGASTLAGPPGIPVSLNQNGQYLAPQAALPTPHHTLLLPHLGLLLEKFSRMCRGGGVRSNPTGLQWSRPLASVCLFEIFVLVLGIFMSWERSFSLFSFLTTLVIETFKCCSSSTWKAQEQEQESISLRCCSCSCLATESLEDLLDNCPVFSTQGLSRE